MDEQLMQQIQNAYQQVVTGNQHYREIWKHDIVFTWRWWLSITLLLLSWAIWFRFRKREIQDRLLYAGLIVIILSCWMDFIGVISGMWFYTAKLIPTMPAYLTLDFSILPVQVMLLIQWKPHLSSWFKGLLFGAFNAFVAEPLLEWIDVYIPTNWQEIYSFPIYILIYLIAHTLAYKRHNFQEIR
ncbi:MAG: CBO0543 family protein [Tumebacillaceae bacterium]